MGMIHAEITLGNVADEIKAREGLIGEKDIRYAETVLLGAIPLEGMDLMINPKTQELAGDHGDTVEYMVF